MGLTQPIPCPPCLLLLLSCSLQQPLQLAAAPQPLLALEAAGGAAGAGGARPPGCGCQQSIQIEGCRMRGRRRGGNEGEGMKARDN